MGTSRTASWWLLLVGRADVCNRACLAGYGRTRRLGSQKEELCNVLAPALKKQQQLLDCVVQF
jgi:hypothetical protein